MTNDFTTADADRLLGFADQFIEDWETDEGAIDSDERKRVEEYRRIRPLLATAPRLLDALEMAEVAIRLELNPFPGTGLHRLLTDIQAAIDEAALAPPKAAVPSKKQELRYRILALLPPTIADAMLLAKAIVAEVTQFFYDPDRAIADVWSIEDIQLVRPDLDDGQARQVLHYIKTHNDSKSGLCWSSLELWADDLFPPSNERIQP